MIKITDKLKCCGCSACVQVCPQQCISFDEDKQGFRYPMVDISKCIKCGLCEKVCPCLTQNKPLKPQKVYAAINKNDEIRNESSSGGMFTFLAESVINKGGVVFGARFNEKWEVIHDYTETIQGLDAFRGSKYVQSVVGTSYIDAQRFLKSGRRVLFSGTPCQIAGLKHFLRKDYENLLTVDVVCHGVPSPLVWRTYLKETNKKIRAKRVDGKNTVLSDVSLKEMPVITGISFRDKTNGWKKYGFVIHNTIKELVHTPHYEDSYFKGYLNSLYSRPICHNCMFKSGCGNSDLSIADFWGVDKVLPDFYDDKGCSLVLVNTSKGVQSLSENRQLAIAEVSYDSILKHNSAIVKSHLKHKNSEKFYRLLFKRKSVTFAVERCLSDNLYKRIIKIIKSIIKRILHR